MQQDASRPAPRNYAGMVAVFKKELDVGGTVGEHDLIWRVPDAAAGAAGNSTGRAVQT